MLPTEASIRSVLGHNIPGRNLSIAPGKDKFKMAHPCIGGYRGDSSRSADKLEIDTVARSFDDKSHGGFCGSRAAI